MMVMRSICLELINLATEHTSITNIPSGREKKKKKKRKKEKKRKKKKVEAIRLTSLFSLLTHNQFRSCMALIYLELIPYTKMSH
jgi:hypothetical protein